MILSSQSGSAQSLRKTFEDDAFIEYELRNDSLAIAPAYELLADYSSSATVFQIIEINTTTVQVDNTKRASLLEALDIDESPSFIQQLRRGYVKGKEVVSLRIHATRSQPDSEELLVTRYAKFRVFKNSNASVLTSTSFNKQMNADHPLSSGTWYRIPVSRDGIHEITSTYLQDLGINVNSINPQNIQLWGTSGREIPRANNAPREAFQQIPIIIQGETDGSFDANDRILFYGDDTNTLTLDTPNNLFIPSVHHYSDFNYYFLTVSDTQGLRLSSANTNLSGTRSVDQFKDVIWIEEELFKADAGIKSGREWLGQRFSANSNGLYASVLLDTIPGIIENQQVDFFATVVGRSERLMRFDARLNNEDVASVNVSPIQSYSSETGTAGNSRIIRRSLNAIFTDEIVNVELRINHNESSTEGFLDRVYIHADRITRAERDFLYFFAPQDGDASEIATYTVSDFTNDPIVMEVSDPTNPRLLTGSSAGNNFVFNYNTNPANQFVAQATYFTPLAGSQVVNQNLHGIANYPNYVVVTSERFVEQATELANYRAQNDNFTPVVVTQNQIFNEFAGGKPDVTAIRDYVKFLYDRAIADGQTPPQYLLLFGNSTFDFKGIIPNGLTNDVFTYQSAQSLGRTTTFATDDYFGLLDDSEGDLEEGNSRSQRIDIAIGRIPAETISEARTAVQKVQAYDNQADNGDWKNLFTFVADDDFPDIELNRDLHVLNAEGTLQRMDANGASIRFNRIYEFDYPVETTGAGRQIPQATQDFINTINSGTLVINYSGHGNEQVLSDEELFVSELVEQLDNADRLTIFITATCQFGRFDDIDDQSGAEKMFFAPDGGAVASFTTTRVVFTSANIGDTNNFGLNIALSQSMLERDADGLPLRLGDIYFRTKNTSVGGSVNTRKFILIGDPATRIQLPSQQVDLASINGNTDFDTDPQPLQIRALDTVQLTGTVQDVNGNDLTSYNGDVTISVFDAPRTINLPERPWVLDDRCNLDDCQYQSQNDLVFRGRARVTNGSYSSQFIIPRDIAFSSEQGRILLYASNGEVNAGGAFQNVVFNGINPDAVDDGRGPELDVYLNDQNFVNGNLVNDTPTLVVELSDQSGINTTGTGVGHEIIATIDTEPSTTVVLNPFFEGNLDDFTGGRIEYPLNQLPEGKYTLTVRAWDVHNNPSEKSIIFEVASAQDLRVRNVYNYPNPMHNRTQFTFEHNQPGNPLDVSIRIFTLSGRPVQNIQESIITSNSYASIPWDGRDRDNDRLGNGTYIYVLRVATDTPEGRETFEKIEKLVIIR